VANRVFAIAYSSDWMGLRNPNKQTNRLLHSWEYLFSVELASIHFYSDGVFGKNYGNRNRKQVVPAVVCFAKQGTETETTNVPGRPARPPEAKIGDFFF